MNHKTGLRIDPRDCLIAVLGTVALLLVFGLFDEQKALEEARTVQRLSCQVHPSYYVIGALELSGADLRASCDYYKPKADTERALPASIATTTTKGNT